LLSNDDKRGMEIFVVDGCRKCALIRRVSLEKVEVVFHDE